MELQELADKEKIYSVPKYVPESKSLFEALQEFQKMGLSAEEIVARFDQSDFEEAHILLWTTSDVDDLKNFLVFSKGFDALGNEILGIKKKI